MPKHENGHLGFHMYVDARFLLDNLYRTLSIARTTAATFRLDADTRDTFMRELSVLSDVLDAAVHDPAVTSRRLQEECLLIEGRLAQLMADAAVASKSSNASVSMPE